MGSESDIQLSIVHYVLYLLLLHTAASSLSISFIVSKIVSSSVNLLLGLISSFKQHNNFFFSSFLLCSFKFFSSLKAEQKLQHLVNNNYQDSN